MAMMHALFARLGGAIARQPRKTMLIGILVSLACAVGWVRIFIEERPERLYTPQGSQAFADKEYVEAKFGFGFRRLDIFVTPRDASTPLASKAALKDVFAVYRKVMNASTTVNGKTIGLRDVCLVNARGDCSTESVLAFFNYSEAVLDSTADAALPAAISAVGQADCCGLSAVITPDVIMGSVTKNPQSGVIQKVGAYRISLAIHNNLIVKTDGSEPKDPKANAVERAVDQVVRAFDARSSPAPPSVRTSVFTFEAFERESSEAINGDTSLVSLSYMVLTGFATLVMWSEFGRCALGPICVGVVMLSVGASFGIIVGLGQPFSLVVSSTIFVLLGLGVDDAFVIMASYARQPRHLTTVERMSSALATAGGSITLTSLTDLVAFMIGSTTVIPALQAFCIFSGVAVMFDFALQVTVFIAAVVMLGDRNCCVGLPRQRGQATAKVGGSADDTGSDGTAAGEEEGAAKPSRMQVLVGESLPRAILSRTGKAAVFTVTAVCFIGCCFGAAGLKLEFKYDWFIPDGTDVKKTMDTRDQHFGGAYLPLELVTKDADYFALRNDFAELTTAFQGSSYVLPGSVDSWYDAFRTRTLLTGELAVPTTRAAFFAAIHGFVNSAQGERFANSIVFDAKNSSIDATRVSALFAATKGITDEINAMDAVREVCAGFPTMNAIAYTYPMLFWEGLRVVETEIIRNVSVAAACVFFVCWAVLKSLSAGAIVLFVIAMIDVCLLGSMHIVGDHINMVTAINLLLAIGLCIDYSAHVVHAFLEAEGTRDERAAKALNNIGLSVFNGGMSTFIATLTMFTAKSYIFQVFGRMFVLIVFWGLYFGMVVLPVLLSLIGPPSHKTHPAMGVAKPAMEQPPSPACGDKAVSTAVSVPNAVL